MIRFKVRLLLVEFRERLLYWEPDRQRRNEKLHLQRLGWTLKFSRRVELESLSRLGVTWNIRRIRDEKTSSMNFQCRLRSSRENRIDDDDFFYSRHIFHRQTSSFYRRVVVVTSRSVFRYSFFYFGDFSFSSNLSLSHAYAKKSRLNISNFHWSVWNRFDLDCCFPR